MSDAFKRAAVKFGVGRELYGDGVATFRVPAAVEAARKDARPFATLVADELARRHREYREEHPGAAAVVDEDAVHRHLLQACVNAGLMGDPGLVSDGRIRRLLGDLYKQSAMYGPLRKELSVYLTAAFAEAHKLAALEEAGDGALDDGLVEAEGGELVPAGAKREREPGEEG